MQQVWIMLSTGSRPCGVLCLYHKQMTLYHKLEMAGGRGGTDRQVDDDGLADCLVSGVLNRHTFRTCSCRTSTGSP